MGDLTLDEATQYIAKGGSEFSDYPSGQAWTAALLLNWVNGMSNTTRKLQIIAIIRAFLGANSGTGN